MVLTVQLMLLAINESAPYQYRLDMDDVTTYSFHSSKCLLYNHIPACLNICAVYFFPRVCIFINKVTRK